MNRILLTSIILFVSISVFSQSSVKGFKSFEKGEYDKAVETFKKHLLDDTSSCAAYFGLALTLSVESYASHDYFKAWDNYEKAMRHYSKLTEEEKLYFKDFFTTRDPKRRSKTVRYNFEYEEKDIQDRLIKYVREENNIEVAEHFLAVYPNSKYYENVVHIRNHIKFRLAEKANTLEAYNEFIKKYPDAAQVPKAINATYKLAFDIAKKTNTIEGYVKFMKEYPQADQYFEALKIRDQLAFDDAKKKNTIEAMEAFIANYPKALQLMNARTILRKLLYDRAKQVNTLEAYNDFISKYPEGELYVDIFNLKSSVLGQNIAARFEGAKDIVVWAKGFDFNEKNDVAGGIIVTPEGKTIVAGNRQKLDEEGSQSWLVCIDNAGKVAWNKTFGSKNYNHANLMALTPKGELLMAGWCGAATDTLSHRAWIFKATVNGGGVWEKTIDGNEIKDLALTPEGDMYLSGYQIDDSSRMKTFVQKLNPETRKLWSRQYIKKGSLEGIALNTKGDLACAAGRWVWKLDKQGYIVWEKTIAATDSIFVPRYVGLQLFLCGSRNGAPLILKMSDTGLPAGEISSMSAEPTQIINCLSLPNKRFLTLENPGDKVKMRVIDDKGTEIRYLSIPNASVYGPGALTTDLTGAIYLTFTALNDQKQGDICIVKLNL
jgi:tetratricopeptide (TPR) repeat protein